MVEVEVSLENAISSGEDSDVFALKCCIKRRKPELKTSGSYLHYSIELFNLRISPDPTLWKKRIV
jgi:hypothetical protein